MTKVMDCKETRLTASLPPVVSEWGEGMVKSFGGQSHWDDLNSFISLGMEESDLVGHLLLLTDLKQLCTFCATLRLIFPGWEVELVDLMAVNKVLRITVDLEHIPGYLFDMSIVTDHCWQWDFSQCMQLLRSENSWFLPPESAMIFSEAVYSLLEGIWCWILPKMGIWSTLIHQAAGAPPWKEVSPVWPGLDSATFLPVQRTCLFHTASPGCWAAVTEPPLLYPESKCHFRQRLLQVTHGLELVLLNHMGLQEWAAKKTPLATGLKSKFEPCWEQSLACWRWAGLVCHMKHQHFFPIINAMGKVCFQGYLPVPITQVPELGTNDAGQEGSNSALGNKGLCDCPNPEVNIVRCPIQLHELLGQFGIA